MSELAAFGVAIAVEMIKFATSATGLGDGVKRLLRADASEQAVARAMTAALTEVEEAYPAFAASLFDAGFVTSQAPLLGRLLTRTGVVHPSEIALAWSQYLGSTSEDIAYGRVRDAESVSAMFLNRLTLGLLNEPALKDIADARALEQVTCDVAAIKEAVAESRPTLGTRLDYFEWLRARNLYLDARGTLQTQRQVQLRLEDVYVGLAAQRETSTQLLDKRLQTDDYEELTRRLQALGMAPDEISHQLTGLQEQRQLRTGTDARHVTSLADFVHENGKVVVLGDPGSGKTTLLRHLASQAAESALADLRSRASTSARTPILIRVATYAEHGLPRSLSDSLGDLLSQAECPATAISLMLAEDLEAGRCTVLLDGLDEVTSADDRRAVVRQIDSFVERHAAAGNTFIVTSRVAGYGAFPLAADFEHCVVLEMTQHQQHQFLRRWCDAVEAAETPDLPEPERLLVANREIDGITRAISHSAGVARLATNPLMLRILALIHRTGAVLPDKRIELYKLSAETLSRTWRLAQGVPEAALVKDERLTRLLGSLAHWMHLTRPTGIASHDDVVQLLVAEYGRLTNSPLDEDGWNPDVAEEVEKFLMAVRIQTGLFVERAPRRYGFMHLTFEEYYTARHLIASRRRSAAAIRSRLHDPRWEEPILLALGFKGLDYPEEASDLIEEAILTQGEGPACRPHDPYDEYLGWDFLFALRCAADGIPLEPELFAELLTRAERELLDWSSGPARFSEYRRDLLERLGALAGTDEVSAIVERLLRLALDDAGVPSRALSAAAQIFEGDPQRLIPTLTALTQRGSVVARLRAVEVLPTIVSQDAAEIPADLLPIITMLVSDADPQVAEQALDWIGELDAWPPALLDAVGAQLDSRHPAVRRAAIIAITGQTLEGVTRDSVIARLDDESLSADVAWHIFWYIDNLDHDAEAIAPVASYIRTASDFDARYAAQVFTRAAPRSLVSLDLAFSSMRDLHPRIARLVGGAQSLDVRRDEDPPPEARAALGEYLADEDDATRALAYVMLLQLDNPDDEQLALRRSALRDPSELVRLCSLQASNPPVDMPGLAGLVADVTQPDLVRAAAVRLAVHGALYEDAGGLQSLLLSALESGGSETRRIALIRASRRLDATEEMQKLVLGIARESDSVDDSLFTLAVQTLGLSETLSAASEELVRELLQAEDPGRRIAAVYAARAACPEVRALAEAAILPLVDAESAATLDSRADNISTALQQKVATAAYLKSTSDAVGALSAFIRVVQAAPTMHHLRGLDEWRVELERLVQLDAVDTLTRGIDDVLADVGDVSQELVLSKVSLLQAVLSTVLQRAVRS